MLLYCKKGYNIFNMFRIGMCMIKVKKTKKAKLTNTSKLILKSKRRRLVKRLIIVFMIFGIGLGIFAIKSDFFIVKKVAILGNPIMSGEDIKKRTENLIGQNILFINKQKIIEEAKKNPYVEKVEISRSYPKQININISEKQGTFYVEKDGQKFILDGEGTLLEETDDIENRSLVYIKGIDLNDVQVGNKAIDNNRASELINIFYQIIRPEASIMPSMNRSSCCGWNTLR